MEKISYSDPADLTPLIQIARKAFGNIAIANADAGAGAYTHVAIDQAYRAINDLN